MDKNVGIPTDRDMENTKTTPRVVPNRRPKPESSRVTLSDDQTKNPSGDTINVRSLPVSQPSAQNPEAGAPENSTRTPRKARKNKPPKSAKKKQTQSNFPVDVKGLLATGILDGVPVKYIALAEEKTNIGLIKGGGYLCGCLDCNFDQALTALEFERHAGCSKTKHPNQRIHFDNSKTIYNVVQELKETPPESLFEAIENATGSDVHEENFRIWKESFRAASRELQRIDGDIGEDQAAPPTST